MSKEVKKFGKYEYRYCLNDHGEKSYRFALKRKERDAVYEGIVKAIVGKVYQEENWRGSLVFPTHSSFVIEDCIVDLYLWSSSHGCGMTLRIVNENKDVRDRVSSLLEEVFSDEKVEE
ncbi:MAG: hypothetical protein KJ592_00350 [Nanoarchaeota archaeon]|nr:hypothetical protein [Nanoarchaeota archaeon]